MVDGVFQKDYYLDEERRAVLLVDGVCQKDYYLDEEREVVEWIPLAKSESQGVAPLQYTNLALVSLGVHPRRRRGRALLSSVRQDQAQVQPEVLSLPPEISSLAENLFRPSLQRLSLPFNTLRSDWVRTIEKTRPQGR